MLLKKLQSKITSDDEQRYKEYEQVAAGKVKLGTLIENDYLKAKLDYENKIAELTELVKQNSDLDENENKKRFLFLEIKKLKAETKYQKQMVVSQTMHLVRSILFEALVPALIFVNLVFLPLGIGFGVLGAVVALAILSNTLINNVYINIGCVFNYSYF